MSGVSPELQKAMKEIELVLQKYDVGGFVSLQDGLGNGEFRMFVDTPTWSMIRFLKDKGDGYRVHLKMYAKSKNEQLNRTINMLYNGQGVLGNMFTFIDEMKKQIAPHLEVTEEQGFIIPPGGGQ